jgi:hypothetical protein
VSSFYFQMCNDLELGHANDGIYGVNSKRIWYHVALGLCAYGNNVPYRPGTVHFTYCHQLPTFLGTLEQWWPQCPLSQVYNNIVFETRLPNIVIARPPRTTGLHHNEPRFDNMLGNIHGSKCLGFQILLLPKINKQNYIDYWKRGKNCPSHAHTHLIREYQHPT